jgi:hypothetical protein
VKLTKWRLQPRVGIIGESLQCGRDKFEAVVADARDAVSRAVKTVQRHFVRRRHKEHASNEACANENYSKKADGDCFK